MSESVGEDRRWLEHGPDGRTKRDIVLDEIRKTGKGPSDKDLKGINFSGEDLKGIDFSRCDLSHADLSQCDLSNAKFTWSILIGTDMNRACLNNCEFLKADMKKAQLHGCEANNAGFGAVNLSGASLFESDLTGSTLSNAELEGTDFRTAILKRARLCNSNLKKSSFISADLREADFSESVVWGANFQKADLRGAHLTGISSYDHANWVATDIRSVNFSGAYLVRRYIMDENYLYEFKKRSRLHTFLFFLWKFTSDCGRSITRWAIFTSVIAVFFGFIFSFVELNHNNPGDLFINFYYSVVTLTTLGYGDIVPINTEGRILVIFEVTMGYVCLGGLISIISNKMVRLAE